MNFNIIFFNYYARQTIYKKLSFQNSFFYFWSYVLKTNLIYIHSCFHFNISLQFSLVTFLKAFCSIAQEGFGFLKMLVNLAQYRVTVGIFNNHQIIKSLYYEASLYLGMSNNLSNYGCRCSSQRFYFCYSILFLSKGNILKITTNLCCFFCS